MIVDQMKEHGYEMFGKNVDLMLYPVFFVGGYHKMDIDNLIKGVQDAMQWLVYANDNQVIAYAPYPFESFKNESYVYYGSALPRIYVAVKPVAPINTAEVDKMLL